MSARELTFDDAIRIVRAMADDRENPPFDSPMGVLYDVIEKLQDARTVKHPERRKVQAEPLRDDNFFSPDSTWYKRYWGTPHAGFALASRRGDPKYASPYAVDAPT